MPSIQDVFDQLAAVNNRLAQVHEDLIFPGLEDLLGQLSTSNVRLQSLHEELEANRTALQTLLLEGQAIAAGQERRLLPGLDVRRFTRLHLHISAGSRAIDDLNVRVLF